MKNNHHIYVAKLKNQTITYTSKHTLVPIVVGASSLEPEEKIKLLNEGHLFDDKGINISNLNPFFAELTSIYWIIKNSNYDYIGNAHYRRKWDDSETDILDQDVLYVHNPLIVPESNISEQFNISCNWEFDAYSITTEISKKGLIPFSVRQMEFVWGQKILYPCLMARGPQRYYKIFMNTLFDCLWVIWNEHKEQLTSYDGYNCRMIAYIAERIMTAFLLYKNSFFDFPIFTSKVELIK